MRILNDRVSVLKVVDAINYEWFFSDSGSYIWFSTEEIPHFLKYIRLRGYSKMSNLYKNGPDIMGSTKRYFIAPFTEQQEKQLEEIYGQQKEVVSDQRGQKGDIQMETEE